MRLPLLILQIVAGTVGLLSGTFAIAVRKNVRYIYEQRERQ